MRPSKVISYNGWEPRPVRFSQPLVASLGALRVTATFKRRQQDSGPKVIVLKGLSHEILIGKADAVVRAESNIVLEEIPSLTGGTKAEE